VEAVRGEQLLGGVDQILAGLGLALGAGLHSSHTVSI
jgi:hypothetical protein